MTKEQPSHASVGFDLQTTSSEIPMPKENDLKGAQDMGGKHGGQAGMPKPKDRSNSQQGIVRDEKGQEQPVDKDRAQSSPPSNDSPH
jgi:hypothetical protein